MHDHIAVVEHGPTAAGAIQPIQLERAYILPEFQFFEQAVFDGLRLAFVVDCGDDEVLSNAGEFVDV